MAWSEIETKIANPARKGTMAKKKLSAKQIKFFGTPRQKAALKAKRKAAASHRPRTKPKKKTNTAMGYRGSSGKPKGWSTKKKKKNGAMSSPLKFFRPKKKLSASKPKRKKNPGELIAFLTGNPARKKGTAMAKSHKKKRKSAASSHAGRPRKKKLMNKARRKNAGGGGALPRPMEWAKLGVSGLGGGVLTRIIPQFAGATNTGGIGYALNVATMVLLTGLVHMFAKDRMLTIGTATGGAIATLLRVVGDNTSYGSQLALSGFGDYMVSNFVTPQRIVNPGAAIWEVPNGWGSTPAITNAMGARSGADAGTDGNSY